MFFMRDFFVWPAGLVFRKPAKLFSVSNLPNNKFEKSAASNQRANNTSYRIYPHVALCDKTLYQTELCHQHPARWKRPYEPFICQRADCLEIIYVTTTWTPKVHGDKYWLNLSSYRHCKHMNDNAENWEKVVSGQAERSCVRKRQRLLFV